MEVLYYKYYKLLGALVNEAEAEVASGTSQVTERSQGLL